MQFMALALPRFATRGRAFSERGYNPVGCVAGKSGDELMNAQDDQALGHTAARNGPYPYDPRVPKMFDMTMNIPTVLSMLSMVAVTIVSVFGLYLSFNSRLATLEMHDREQEEHFARIEAGYSDFKTETNKKLDNISTTVTQVRDWMISDGRVSNQPEAARWTKK